MNRFARITAVLLAVLFILAAPTMAFAQTGDAAAVATPMKLGAIGAGIVMLGASYGIGRIGGNAVESMARQPEIAAALQTAMIIAAALIEGATFFALYICMIS